MSEHTVYVDKIGGATVLTSESLGFKNIEHVHDKLDEKTISDTITHYKSFSKDEMDAIEIRVVDNRPPEENYNEQRARESKEHKPKNRNFI